MENLLKWIAAAMLALTGLAMCAGLVWVILAICLEIIKLFTRLPDDD